MNPTAPNGGSAKATAGFRNKLLATMVLVVSAITAVILFLTQRSAEGTYQQRLQAEFQSRFDTLLGAQETRLAVVTERCRSQAKSVRIRAAIAEEDLEDLYQNAMIELGDVLKPRGSVPEGRGKNREPARPTFFVT